MKILYITYENVYRTGILQAMVIKPLSILSKLHKIDFIITSTVKGNEKDLIYDQNKRNSKKKFPILKIQEFDKNLQKDQSILTFVRDLIPILQFSIKQSKDCDIIHCRGYGGALIGMVVSFLTKKPFIFDMRGTLPEETVEVGKIGGKSIKFRLLKLVEKILIKRSRYVFTVSGKFNEYVKENFGKKEVLNINNPTDFNSYSTANNENSKITFIYSGSMQVWHDPKTTILYFSKLYEEFPDKIYLIFCTNELEEAKKLFQESGLPATSFEINSVPFNEMPEYYRRSDIAFCFIRNSFSKSICFPVKFSEYIASELFILTNDGIGDLSKIVKEYNCGLSFHDLSLIDQNTETISEVVQSFLDKKITRYNRNELSFLDWNQGGVEKIYEAYLEILQLPKQEE